MTGPMTIPFYEGVVSNNNHHSVITGSLDERVKAFDGVAHMGASIYSWLYIAPLRHYDKSAAASQMIVYYAADRIANETNVRPRNDAAGPWLHDSTERSNELRRYSALSKYSTVLY